MFRVTQVCSKTNSEIQALAAQKSVKSQVLLTRKAPHVPPRFYPSRISPRITPSRFFNLFKV